MGVLRIDAFCKRVFIMKERYGLERELEALGVRSPSPASGGASPPSGAAPTSPTLGFEFDLNYGFEEEVANKKGPLPKTGFWWPQEHLKATDHQWKDDTGTKLKDAFVVTMDAVRMEISTVPFHIENDIEFNTVVHNVLVFGKELIDAYKARESFGISGVNKGEKPTTFFHPRTVLNKQEKDSSGNVKFPGDRDKAEYFPYFVPLVIVRVGDGKGGWVYPREKTELKSSPQATITLPLSKFGDLVKEIHRTMGKEPGEAFTGRKTDRLGLRDDLAYYAQKWAIEDSKKMLGTMLSDGTVVTYVDYNPSITSVVTILVMYMLTGILKDKYWDRDRRKFYSRDQKKESFAKGSLPLNLKTPLWQIHKFALTPREKFVLHELVYRSPKQKELVCAGP